MTYSYFKPRTYYRRGDRVLTKVLDKTCLWECITDHMALSSLKPYTYTLKREKVYYWRQLCCEPHTTNKIPSPAYYGECTQNIPRNTPLLLTNVDPLEADNDYYENLIFL